MEEQEEDMEQSEKSPLIYKTSLSTEKIPVFKGTPEDSRGSPDGGRAWLVAFAIFVVNFLIIGMGRVSGLFYVDYMEVFHVKRGTASTPFAVQQSIRSLFGPVVGILGQMFSVRAMTMTGGLMAAVSTFSCAFVPNILWITIFWGDLYGIATAFTSTINQALINMYFLNNRTTASGIAFAGGSLGAMVFPFLIQTLLIKWGVPETYFTMAFLLLLIIPVAIIMKKPPWMTPQEEIEWSKGIDSGSHGHADSRNKLYQADSCDHDNQSSSPYYEGRDEVDDLPSKFRSLYERSREDSLITSNEKEGSLGEVDGRGGGDGMRPSQGFVGKLLRPVVETLKEMFIEPVEEVSSPTKYGTAKREASSDGTPALSSARFHTEDHERVRLLPRKSSEAKPAGFFGMLFSPVVDTLKEMFIEPTEEDFSDVISETNPQREVEDASYRKASIGSGSTPKNIDVVVEKKQSNPSVRGTGYEEKPHEFEGKVCLSAPTTGERQIRENISQWSHSNPSSLSATSPPLIPPIPYSSSAPLESSFLYQETFPQSGISVKAISPVKLPPPSIRQDIRKYSSESIEKQLQFGVDSKSEQIHDSVTSSSTRAMQSLEKALVEQISDLKEKDPTPHSEAEGYDRKSTFSTEFLKFPSIDRKDGDAEFLYTAHSSPNEQEEIKKKTSSHPPQNFEVLVEKIGAPKHELKQKSTKSKRKAHNQNKTGFSSNSVSVKGPSSGLLTSISRIEVINPGTPSLGEQKDVDFDPITVNFRFLHENIRYIMHIIRITEASLIESRDSTKFHDLASENLEFESALEFFFCCIEETVPSQVEYVPNEGSSMPDEIIFVKERLGSDPEDGKDLRENHDQFKMKADFNRSFTNRQIFDLLQVLFRQNESVTASHFPEKDQEKVLKVISESKKLIQHCHSMNGSKCSSAQGNTLKASDTREKSVSKSSSISLLEIERTMRGLQRNENLILTTTEADRPPSEQNVANSGNKSDIPPMITLWDQTKVAIKLHANPLFLLICLCRVVYFFTFTCVLTIIVDYGVDRGLSLTRSVFLLSALSLGDFIGRIFTGWITDRGIVNLEIFMAITMIFQGVLSTSFSWAPARYLYIITGIFSVSQGAVFVRHPVLLCKYTRNYEHSIALGFSNFFAGILGFGMPRYIGYFRDTLGSYCQIFSINGGVCLLVGVIWTFVPCYLRCSPH